MDSKEGINHWHTALDLIASKQLKLNELISRRISLEEAPEVFEFYNREEWIKVIIEPFK